jgi:hypothetical protein
MVQDAGPSTYQQAYESFKAAQFHALHQLEKKPAGGEAPGGPRYSAALYVTEPLEQWVAEASPELRDAFSSLLGASGTGGAAPAETRADAVLAATKQLGLAGGVLYPTRVLSAYQKLGGPALSAVCFCRCSRIPTSDMTTPNTRSSGTPSDRSGCRSPCTAAPAGVSGTTLARSTWPCTGSVRTIRFSTRCSAPWRSVMHAWP